MFVKNGFNLQNFKWPTVAVIFSLALAGFAVARQSGGKPAAPPAAANPPETLALFPGGLPKLEQFLTVALERHPDVVVARSKVEAARSELLKAEATALRELVQLHQNTQSSRTNVESLKNQPSPVSSAAVAMLQTEAARLNLLEWEAALALGFPVSGKQPVPKGSGTGSQAKAEENAVPPVFLDIAYPKGNMAAKFKEALLLELNDELADAKLKDVCAMITDKTGIQVVIDETSLTEFGFETDTVQFNLKATGATVASLVQQVEDRYRPLQFMVRDYGILVTLADYAPSDAISIRDFANLSEQEIRDKYRAKR